MRTRKPNSRVIGTNYTLCDSVWSAANLRARYEAATAAEVAEGEAWYQAAHTFCLGLSERYSITVRQAAGIVAALSPQVSWDENLRLADTVCRTGTADALGGSVRKAQTILNGADPHEVLGGRKVRSFFHNILTPERVGPVTIDRHALAILAGLETPRYLDKFPKLVDRRYAYRYAAAIYRQVAAEYGISPQTLQAITWVSHRNAEWVEEF